ncbi:MAG: DapH/DapD/GlmU-related protein [Deltaproteobacteria bacterium]|nr:DapH/DapD/GlmU-related protein [Deltaproteobacteria bacterium]
MLGLLLDLGRIVGGLVVFGLCALFAAVGLAPCYHLFVAIQDNFSTFWAVVSTPFLYLVWGTTYCACCVVFKWLMFYHPKPGEWKLFSWSVVGWGLTGATTNFANEMFLKHFKGTPMLNIWFTLLGAKIGKRVSINSVLIFDWNLITIEDDVVVGGDAVLMAHSLEGGQMRMRPVRLGKKSMIGGNAKVMPGCVLGEGAVLGASSLLTKGIEIPAGHMWGGIPAKFLKDRNAPTTSTLDAEAKS